MNADFLVALVGFLLPLALILSGIFVVQVHYYLLTYSGDPLFLKAYVTVIWVLEMFQSTLAIHVIYAYINAALYNPEALARITWSCGGLVIVEAVVIGLVHSFYAYRVWILYARRWAVAFILGLAVVLRVGLSLVTALFTYLLPEWLEFEDTLAIKYSINTGFSLAILVDLSLAAFLLYELIQKRRTLRFKAHYIQTIMTYTIGTGAVTVLCSMAILITYNVMPGNLTFAGLVAIVTKLYANTMLANLNAREHARRAHPQPQFIGTVELSSTNKSKNSRVDFAPSEGAVESLKEGTAATNQFFDEQDLSGSTLV